MNINYIIVTRLYKAKYTSKYLMIGIVTFIVYVQDTIVSAIRYMSNPLKQIQTSKEKHICLHQLLDVKQNKKEKTARKMIFKTQEPTFHTLTHSPK